MNKEKMLNLLSEITELEKLLMRDLNENEIEYLKEHSKEDFLYDILNLDEEDVANLNKIKSYISTWCTSPVESYNRCDATVNMCIDEQTDYDSIEDNDDIFDKNNQEIKATLKDIVHSLEYLVTRKEAEKVQTLQNIEVKTADTNKYNLDDSFSDDNEVPDSIFGEEAPIDFVDNLPADTKKWLTILTINEILTAVNKAVEIVTNDYVNKYPGDIDEEKLNSILTNEDEDFNNELANSLTGEIVDQIKDTAITKYIKQLTEFNELEFEDNEIQSEVLDYLYKNDYKVKSINNKVYLV